MMLSPEYKLHIVCSFDAFCKKVIRFEAQTCYKTIKRKQQREISLDYLIEERYFETSSLDDYFIVQPNFELQSHFYIKGQVIMIENERLALAMMKLPAQKRDVVLLRFFLGFNEKEIAVMYGYQRHTINYHKNRSLKLLRQEMERIEHEEVYL